MLIAGCSGGGHSVGSLPTSGSGGGSQSTLVNGAKVTVSIAVSQKTTLSGRRVSNKVRPTVGKRAPSFVSPSTSSIALSAVYNGSSVYAETLYLSQCTNLYSVYQCSTSLPVGTYTLYASVFDASSNLLGTNIYSSPAPQTIYANGTATYGNYVYADVAGVAKYIFIGAPDNCDTGGSSMYAEIYALDADSNVISGPLANPLVGYVNAINGAGKGAIDLYALSTYGAASADNQVIYDTSLYVPFIYETGLEGSVELYGSTYNIPADFGAGANGAAGFQAGSPSSPAYAQLTVGTYNLVAMVPGTPTLSVYSIEESVPAIVSCNSVSPYPGFSNPSLMGAVVDSSGGSRDLIVVDGQNVDVVGDNMTFYTSGGAPQLAFTESIYTLGSNETPVNLFTSPIVQGRFFVITNNSNNSGFGQADQMIATNGSTVYSGSYQFQFAATTSTRIAGDGGGVQYALYYSDGSDNLIYGVDRTTGSQYPTITAFSSGTVYTLQPSGAGYNYIFFRGYNASATHYQLCTFDPTTTGIAGVNCVNLTGTGAGNSSVVSIRYDSLSADMLAVVGTDIFGGPADVMPSSFSGSNLYTTFTTSQARFTPGEATPGFIGVYETASSPYTTTFLQWNGSSWTSYGSLQWPNAWIVSLH